MNAAEQSVLSGPLSNDARVLYLLALRPHADPASGRIEALNYKYILSVLNAKEQRFTLGRQINLLMKELLDAGLLTFSDEVDTEQSFNKKSTVLPLMVVDTLNYQELHAKHQPMTMEWYPNKTLFEELCQLTGMIDTEYSTTDIGDFKAYWLGRPQSLFTPYQWTQKFVYHLKQRRLATYGDVKAVIGSQRTNVKAALEVDENARKLVKKYGR